MGTGERRQRPQYGARLGYLVGAVVIGFVGEPAQFAEHRLGGAQVLLVEQRYDQAVWLPVLVGDRHGVLLCPGAAASGEGLDQVAQRAAVEPAPVERFHDNVPAGADLVVADRGVLLLGTRDQPRPLVHRGVSYWSSP